MKNKKVNFEEGTIFHEKTIKYKPPKAARIMKQRFKEHSFKFFYYYVGVNGIDELFYYMLHWSLFYKKSAMPLKYLCDDYIHQSIITMEKNNFGVLLQYINKDNLDEISIHKLKIIGLLTQKLNDFVNNNYQLNIRGKIKVCYYNMKKETCKALDALSYLCAMNTTCCAISLSELSGLKLTCNEFTQGTTNTNQTINNIKSVFELFQPKNKASEDVLLMSLVQYTLHYLNLYFKDSSINSVISDLKEENIPEYSDKLKYIIYGIASKFKDCIDIVRKYIEYNEDAKHIKEITEFNVSKIVKNERTPGHHAEACLVAEEYHKYLEEKMFGNQIWLGVSKPLCPDCRNLILAITTKDENFTIHFSESHEVLNNKKYLLPRKFAQSKNEKIKAIIECFNTLPQNNTVSNKSMIMPKDSDDSESVQTSSKSDKNSRSDEYFNAKVTKWTEKIKEKIDSYSSAFNALNEEDKVYKLRNLKKEEDLPDEFINICFLEPEFGKDFLSKQQTSNLVDQAILKKPESIKFIDREVIWKTITRAEKNINKLTDKHSKEQNEENKIIIRKKINHNKEIQRKSESLIPNNNYTKNQLIKIKQSGKSLTRIANFEKVEGDGWCVFTASNINNPEDALEELKGMIDLGIKNEFNDLILEKIRNSIKTSFLFDGFISEQTYAKDLKKSINDDNVEEVNKILNNVKNLKSYLDDIKKQKYGDILLVQAILSLRKNPTSIVQLRYIDGGKFYCEDTDNLKSDKSKIYISYNPGSNLRTAHADKIELEMPLPKQKRKYKKKTNQVKISRKIPQEVKDEPINTKANSKGKSTKKTKTKTTIAKDLGSTRADRINSEKLPAKQKSKSKGTKRDKINLNNESKEKMTGKKRARETEPKRTSARKKKNSEE